MNPPPALVTRPPSHRTPSPLAPLSADEEVGLDALLEWFSADEHGSARPSVREACRRLHGRVQGWSHRAAAWGAVARAEAPAGDPSLPAQSGRQVTTEVR